MSEHYQARREWPGVTLYHADCLDLLPIRADAVITDPPFSERTHAGHDSTVAGHNGCGRDDSQRQALGYAAWGIEQVAKVCASLPPKGWACFITDHVLAREWEAQLKKSGRYVFVPIPVFTRGRAVRLAGDGPSSWTDWMIVSRTKAEIHWGTLPGVYEGSRGLIEHMGGKPTDAMCEIVQDYSRQGDTVLDFCMGSGTTGIACIRTGRKFIGIEKDARYFQAACDRIERELAQGQLFEPATLMQPKQSVFL